MKEIRYRTETAYGEGYRDAIEVMTYETYELGNTDILKTLSSEFFTRNQALQDQCNSLIDELEENGYVDDFSEKDWNQFFKTALQEKDSTMRIRYFEDMKVIENNILRLENEAHHYDTMQTVLQNQDTLKKVYKEYHVSKDQISTLGDFENAVIKYEKR